MERDTAPSLQLVRELPRRERLERARFVQMVQEADHLVPPAQLGGHRLEDLRAFLAARFSRWQLPDAFVFVEQLPHTTTGKLLKADLRKQYKDWEWKKAGSS